MWTNVRYPNLELLQYKAGLALQKDEEFNRIIKEKQGRFVHPELDAVVFPQIWGSTCTGFDETEGGEAVMAGCAMTKEYTTVFHELLSDIYVVFFGDRICYMVHDANETFLEDLKQHQVKSLSQAKKYY